MKNGVGVDIYAVKNREPKNKETFLLTAIGESEGASDGEIQVISAIGETVRRMNDRGIWTSYGIAIPKSYVNFLKDFEAGGIQSLSLNVFIVERLWSLYHLNTKDAIELIQDLKAGKPENLIYLDSDFKMYDYTP